MILDRANLIAAAVAIVARLVASGTHLVAEAAPNVVGLPGAESLSNMTATGAVIFLVFWTTTRTIPGIVADFREERRLDREEAKAHREAFTCKAATHD